ncbi:ankyrin repeat and LEM domain-containing protein 1 isoform X2 [Hemicordylus capensis]|nr:ankyrin repeat and LEM domain-containing protein 1 isoform X2 [Hemicordylus capensis]
MVETLLRWGADPNLLLPEGIAAIHLAAGMEQESGIRCLGLILQHGGDPNVRSVDDLTPLHVAASWGCYTCLRLLLIDGGDPRLQDQDGNTAIDLASEQGNEMCVGILQGFLEKLGEEQNLLLAQRRAESFLTTVTEDSLETGGISPLLEDNPHPKLISSTSKSFPSRALDRAGAVSSLSHPVASAPNGHPSSWTAGDFQDKGICLEESLSCSYLTEDSQECSTFGDHLHLQSVVASSTSCGNRASNPSAVWGNPVVKPAPPTLEANLGSTQSRCFENTSDSRCCLSADPNSTLPCPSLINSQSWTSRVSHKVPNTTEETPRAPSSCAIWAQPRADRLSGRWDADATLNLSHYNGFLDPDLVVRTTGQEGLDVTSPDHAYLFCQLNSTATLDLEKTVVDSALLLRAFRDPDGGAVDKKSFSRTSDGGSISRYTSCDSDCYMSIVEAPGHSRTQICKKREGRTSCSTYRPDSVGNGQLMSQTYLGPGSGMPTCGLEEHVEMRSVTTTSSQGARQLHDALSFRETPSKACTGKPASDLCSPRKNGCPGRTGELGLSPKSQDVLPTKHHLQQREDQSWSTLPSREPQAFQVPKDCGAENAALLEASSSVLAEQVATDGPHGQFKGAVPSEAWEEPNKEERGGRVQASSLSQCPGDRAPQDTMLIQRTPEELQPCAGSEGSDTVAVPHPTLVSREEESTELEMRLRMMLLSTKACHSPPPQPSLRPCHITPRTKSRMASSSTRRSGGSSSSSSLFDETLESPRRPRRVRSPEGARRTPVVLPNESLPCMLGEEVGGLDETQLIALGPSSCKQTSCPGSSLPDSNNSSGNPATLTRSGGDCCRCSNRPGVRLGSLCSRNLEVRLPLEEHTCLPEGVEGDWAAQVTRDAVPEGSGVKPSRPKRPPKHSRVSFSRLSTGGPFSVPGATVHPPGRLSPIRQAVPLSPGGRPVNLSAVEPVEYLYVDEDKGHALVERHIPCTDDSVADTTSSEDTIIYNWRAYASQVVGQATQEGSPLQPSAEVRCLSDEALARKLRDFGVNPGPVTGLTRNVYMKLLEKLMSDPKTKSRKGSAGYSSELSSALETYQIPDGKDDEMALSQQFDQPDKSRKWREGLLKSSFNYLLLDPRVTQNLPFRCQYTSRAECFRTFISAIFYVGKGKRSRPYCHLYEALTHYKEGRTKRGGQVCSKVQHILEIWASGQGVVSMHCFQNVIPVEAYTREACMVDAIGLKMLTNQKKGNYYGVVAGWPMKRRRCLGIHLLHRAMEIFLAEGERHLRPTDIRAGSLLLCGTREPFSRTLLYVVMEFRLLFILNTFCIKTTGFLCRVASRSECYYPGQNKVNIKENKHCMVRFFLISPISVKCLFCRVSFPF